MKSKKPSILLLFLIILTTGQLSANYAFKKKVKSTANSYRINIESKSLILDDPGELIVELRSGRNNCEMFILVGFASAGGAIEHQKEMNLKGWGKEAIESLAVAVCNGAVYEPNLKSN